MVIGIQQHKNSGCMGKLSEQLFMPCCTHFTQHQGAASVEIQNADAESICSKCAAFCEEPAKL